MNKCIGCGILLQTEDKDSLGYTTNIDNLYCERCFRTIHYNEEKKVSDIDNNKIISDINKLELFTLFITDIENINNKVIDIYNSINNKKMLLINKIDMIPKVIDLNHLVDNIKSVYNIDEVLCVSAKNNINMDILNNIIISNNKVILCGETSSGKSTIINNLTNSKLTTSKYNNTTLDIIKINYDNNVIYDTPGIIINNNIKDNNKLIIKNIQINKDYVIEIDNLILRCNGNITVILNSSKNIITKKSNILLDNKQTISNKSDIILPKGGFIYVKSSMEVESNIKLEVRKSIIGR